MLHSAIAFSIHFLFFCLIISFRSAVIALRIFGTHFLIFPPVQDITMLYCIGIGWLGSSGPVFSFLWLFLPNLQEKEGKRGDCMYSIVDSVLFSSAGWASDSKLQQVVSQVV
jgi:hypothetical protein